METKMFAILDKAKPDTWNTKGLNLAASCLRPFKCLDWHCGVSYWWVVGHNLLYRGGLKETLYILYILYSIYIYIYMYGNCVKDKHVNNKCTHRQITRLSYKGQTRPLVREGAPQRQDLFLKGPVHLGKGRVRLSPP
jgi:hypothetical protein